MITTTQLPAQLPANQSNQPAQSIAQSLALIGPSGEFTYQYLQSAKEAAVRWSTSEMFKGDILFVTILGRHARTNKPLSYYVTRSKPAAEKVFATVGIAIHGVYYASRPTSSK